MWCKGKIDPCANTVVAARASLDGAHTAVVFTRDCGATTEASPQVAVLGPQVRAIEEQRDVALTTSARGCTSAVPLETTWTDAGSLEIRVDACAEIRRHASSIDGVRIDVVQSPR